MKRIIIVFLVFFAVYQFSCYKEKFNTDSDVVLTFSVDTLLFDTVFTTLGSATRILKVYNDNDLAVKIESVYLDRGTESKFRINVDGLPGDGEEVEIPANDSIYVFVEVTIDPDDPITSSPFVLDENLKFKTNGNTQNVVLEAWGQNANYLPFRNGNGTIYSICNLGDLVWDSELPYVIYGVLVVDSCQLTIPEGTNIYMHGGIIIDNGDYEPYNDGYLIIGSEGSLVVEGSAENPVVFQTSRLEHEFDDVSGQWNSIKFAKGSTGNYINHAIIKNSILGVLVDSAAELSIKNTAIFYTASSGILGYHAKIDAENCLLYENGGEAFRALYGGTYNLDYCTIVSYGGRNSALSLSNAHCLNFNCSEYLEYRLKANIRNSIIYGSKEDEIVLFDRVGGGEFEYSFIDCIVKEEKLHVDNTDFSNFYTFCNPCFNLENNDVLFVDIDNDDYHLDTLSVAETKASPIFGIDIDLEGNSRDNSNPDIGCFEYQYE